MEASEVRARVEVARASMQGVYGNRARQRSTEAFIVAGLDALTEVSVTRSARRSKSVRRIAIFGCIADRAPNQI